MPDTLWRIDYDSPKSYHNWVSPDKLNLTCVNKNIIGSMISMMFLGFSISSAFIPRLGDKYGRKIPFYLSMTVQTIGYILLFLSHNVYFTIFIWFLIGLCSGGRCAIGTMYMNEYVPIQN